MLVFVLLSMITFAVLQIVLRNVFDTSFFWIDPLNRLLVLWLAILGAMVATREGEHIAIDAIRHYLKGFALFIVTKLSVLFSIAVCSVMTYYSALFVYEEKLYGTELFSQLPAWPFELIMPVGFLIMTLRFLVSLFTKLKVGQQ